MLGNAVRTQVVVALLLAMLMGWVGHASALLSNVNQPASEVAHGHSHDDVEPLSCQACSDHYHAPYTVDHLHETPHLNARLDLPAQPHRSLPAARSQLSLPNGPVFLIERPPRSRFVL
ncbi:hypothetical protein Pres01_39990 [Metapseudomonas resinovorans]|uniref:hypothetical protein n=1 Tax=Metapseudomonas resinovorans TaxID=53412 RepID=UPI0009847A28|nr:hypothetical protein [Pseudomonas resinovorans]GLZ87948.1 hypothetical protein Pres01_39990 [Pseudomonas resinovorans]